MERRASGTVVPEDGAAVAAARAARAVVVRLARVLRVGIVYLAYGLIILPTVYVIVPIGAWWRATGDGHDLLMQRWLCRAAALFRRVAVWLRVIDVSLVGGERLAGAGPLLLVANHPSLLDATLLVSFMPQLDHIVDAGWARNPIVQRAVSAGGYLVNDDPRRVIEDGARRLAAGRRLVVFPEGTRSPVGGLQPFHRGAARIALAAGCELVPVVIRCEPPFGQKGRPWYDVPNETPRLTFEVGAPIAPRAWTGSTDSAGVAARKITRMLEEHFRRALGYRAATDPSESPRPDP